MNIISNEILMLSKVIKVKDKVDRILHKHSIINVITKYTKKYLEGIEKIEEGDTEGHSTLEKYFLSINKHSKILKSPFIIYDQSKAITKTIPNKSFLFIPTAQTISSDKTIEGLLSRDKSIKIGKYSKVKKIVLYVDFLSDKYYIEGWLDSIENNLVPLIQHEWVHVEQLLRARKLKDGDKGIDLSDENLTPEDLKFLSKHQKSLTPQQDNPLLKKLVKLNTRILKKQLEEGLIDEEEIRSFNSDNIKIALTKAAEQSIGSQKYFSMKSEIGAYAVQAAELFQRKDIFNFQDIIFSYVMLGIDSPKIKKKFFRLFSEALQERGVSNKLISEYVNDIYTYAKSQVMNIKQEAINFLEA
jgi:hypothetical protein